MGGARAGWWERNAVEGVLDGEVRCRHVKFMNSSCYGGEQGREDGGAIWRWIGAGIVC